MRSRPSTTIRNPYRDEFLAAMERLGRHDGARTEELYRRRSELIGRYAFAVPDERAIGLLVRLAPIVEIGAGNGYWAWCLEQAGADVIALDKFPPDGALYDSAAPCGVENTWFDDEWSPVLRADETAAGAHPDRTLFLCWPDPRSYMAHTALAAYRAAGGRRLVYIGDPASSGDPRFHAALETLACVERFRIESWPCCDEWCAHYEI